MTKFRSQVAAGNVRVSNWLKTMETDCTEDELERGKNNECEPEVDEQDSWLVMQTDSEMYHLLINMTTGEANAMVRRRPGHGWLAWKKLTSVLTPRTLASGIKDILEVLSPNKIAKATRADKDIEVWEDRMAKLRMQHG